MPVVVDQPVKRGQIRTSIRAPRIVRRAAFVLGVVGSHSAMAAPPQGTDLRSPEHLWWECQRTPGTEKKCCAEADGHNLSDSEWRQSSIGYEVRVGDRWFNVPPEAVIPGAGQCGPEANVEHRSEAKVWYGRQLPGSGVAILIRCFIAGTLY
jgi:hypothetical protein